MTNAKGTRWESRLVAYLLPLFPRVERRAKSGNKDRGDIAGIDGWCIEAKNCRAVNLAGWIDEARVEAVNAGAKYYAVVFPRRNHATERAYVVMELWQLADLMRERDE